MMGFEKYLLIVELIFLMRLEKTNGLIGAQIKSIITIVVR